MKVLAVALTLMACASATFFQAKSPFDDHLHLDIPTNEHRPSSLEKRHSSGSCSWQQSEPHNYQHGQRHHREYRYPKPQKPFEYAPQHHIGGGLSMLPFANIFPMLPKPTPQRPFPNLIPHISFTNQLPIPQFFPQQGFMPGPQLPPQPAPQPSQRPFPQLPFQPAPQPAPKPSQMPSPQPAPQPAPKPAPQPAPQPAPKPAPQPAPQPAPRPTTTTSTTTTKMPVQTTVTSTTTSTTTSPVTEDMDYDLDVRFGSS